MTKEKSEKITEISARIAEIIDKEGVSRNDFALKLGYSRSQTIYDIMNMKSAPSYDFFNRFADSEFSERYSLRWLLTGQGDMTKEKSEKITESSDFSQIISHFTTIIAQKDERIATLERENGMLHERIAHLTATPQTKDAV